MKNYTITVNGNTYNVTVQEGTAAASAVQAAAPAAAPAPAPAATPAVPAAAGGIKVEAPMSGKILAVKASAGQKVEKGEVLMVLEAMKMENDIVAPEAGTVASIGVTVGQAVESGDVLATLN